MRNNNIGKQVWDFLLIFVGASLYAFATAAFIRPIQTPLGGVTGIAQIIGTLTPLPMGVMIIVMNIPLFLLSWREMGRMFIIKTGFSMLWSSVLIDILGERLPIITNDHLLGSLYGGVLMGAGLGLVFSRGATTGGTEIISKLFNKRFEFISIGRFNMVLNAIVIASASIIFRSIEAALFALVVQFVQSSVIDGILHGMDHANCALIITKDADKLASAINHELRRGVTGLHGEGMYTKRENTVLMAAVRSHELQKLKHMVFEHDSQAFLIMLNANEVMGLGFKKIGS